ncbi:MAG: tetratricopeptide repeat protein [Synechococcales bacterium]|nr:tetratricopeptide repeat protein [Synechococcales bacterium]
MVSINSQSSSASRFHQSPDHEYRFLRQQGETLANLGHYLQALECFRQALALRPDAADVWIFQGVTQLHLKQYDAALASCNRAVELEPRNREAWIFRGVALNYLGLYDECYSSYDRALGKTEPTSPKAELVEALRAGRSLLRRLKSTFEELLTAHG